MANKLAGASLGLSEVLVMGIAGTAPAFSVEVTASTLIAAVGVFSVASVLWCGIAMFGITLAFIHLTKVNPHAGASYAWVSDIFGKSWGFFAGWALLVASCLFMVSGTIPAANAFLLLFAPSLMNNVHAVTIIAGLLLTAISMIVLKGIKLTSYTQVAMTLIELAILSIIIMASFTIFPHAMQHPFSWHWFSPFALSLPDFANGALIALFFYWGWDVIMNLNEETKDAHTTSGKGAFGAMLYLLAFFIVFMVIVLIGLSDGDIQHYNTNVIYAIGEKLYGNWFGYAAILAVLLSTLGTLETSILQFTRTLFAKGRDGVLHPRYARVHEKWQTPHVAVITIWLFGLALVVLSSYLPTINAILKLFIGAITFQISFYLGLAGLACAWHFRAKLGEGPIKAVLYVIWPFLSALFLFGVAILSATSFDLLTNVLGLGGIAIGAVPFLYNRRRVSRLAAA